MLLTQSYISLPFSFDGFFLRLCHMVQYFMWEIILSITQYLEEKKEGNVLFNDALNTFYLRLYGVRHMVKDHSDSEKGNPLLPHRLLLSINSKGSFICRIANTMAFVTPVMEHWHERVIAQWVQPMKDRSDDPWHHERTLYLWAMSRSLQVCSFKHQFQYWK